MSTTPHTPAYAVAAAEAKKAQAKMLNRIERLALNSEMTKPQVAKLAADAFRLLLILPSDYNDVKRTLTDRNQCAEDALSALRDFVL